MALPRKRFGQTREDRERHFVQRHNCEEIKVDLMDTIANSCTPRGKWSDGMQGDGDSRKNNSEETKRRKIERESNQSDDEGHAFNVR
uniref:Uncharacterized protein n=1 Tax=Glossina morsitans morsitans TaxID=37546 RepID=A0A1B0FG94_GLOMM